MSHGSSSSCAFEIRVQFDRVALERSVEGDVRVQIRDRQPALGIDTARDVRDRDHRRAPVVELGRRDPADVPEALHDAAQLGQVPAQPPARALDHHHDARSRRLVAEDGAADRDRLAGHDLRHRIAALHRIGVHHPGHRLLVRRHVRRRNVLLRADEAQQLGREAARDPRQARSGSAHAGRSARRPWRRRRAAAAGRTSRSSTSRAPRTRPGRRHCRSGCRPSSARAPRNAAPGRPGTSGASRRPSRSAPSRSAPARASGAGSRRSPESPRSRGRGRAGSAPGGRGACPTRDPERALRPWPRP